MTGAPVALVSGAASGIGAATTAAFRDEGWHVVGVDIVPQGDNVVADVADPRAWEAVAARLREEHGRLDALVNNAGINTRGRIEDLELAAWERVLAVNLTSMFLATKCCLPLLRLTGGAIVNVGSGVGLVGAPRTPAYAASKGGVIALTRQLAVDYAGDGIRANVVCPGIVDTPGARRLADGQVDPEAALQAFAAAELMGRLGTAAEIASAIVFLASPRASFITGAVLPVDGGYTAR